MRHALLLALTPAVVLLSSMSMPAEAATPEAVAAHSEGLRLKKNNQVASAVKAFERATQLDSTFADAWTDLGNAYLAANDPARAATAFEGALKASPNLQVARYNLAYALRKTGQHAKAAVQYKTYLTKSPNDADAQYGLAESLKVSGDLAGAADAYEAYARVEKRDGQAKWVKKARDQATALRQEIAKKSPPKTTTTPTPTAAVTNSDKQVAAVPAKKGMHLSFSENGAPADTGETTAAAPTAAASARPAAFRTGLDRLQRGSYEDAEARLRVALGDAPNDPIVVAALASAQLGQMNGVDAESSYQRALTNAPAAAQPGIFLGLGEAQRIQGKLDAAKQSYRSALQHQSASSSVKRFSQERLDALQ